MMRVPLGHTKDWIRNMEYRGAWVAQSVGHPTSAQVMITQSNEFEPRIRPCADNSEPGACIGFCVFLSFCPSLAHALSLSVSKINKNIKKIKKKEMLLLNLYTCGNSSNKLNTCHAELHTIRI